MKKTADFLWGIALSIAVAISGIFNYLAFAQTNSNSGGSGGYNGSAGSGGSNNSVGNSLGGSGPTICGSPADYHWKKPLSSGTGLAVNVNLSYTIFGSSYELDKTTNATTAEIRVTLRAYDGKAYPILCENNAQAYVSSRDAYYVEFRQTAENSCDSSVQGSNTGGVGPLQIGQSFSSTCGFSVPYLLWDIMCKKQSYTRSDSMHCKTTVLSAGKKENGESLDHLFEYTHAMPLRRGQNWVCTKTTTKDIFLRNLEVFAVFAKEFHLLGSRESSINFHRIHDRKYLEEIVDRIQEKYFVPLPTTPANGYRNAKCG